MEFLEMDINAEDALKRVKEVLQQHNRKKVDVVLSDMAPITLGNKNSNHQRLMVLQSSCPFLSKN